MYKIIKLIKFIISIKKYKYFNLNCSLKTFIQEKINKIIVTNKIGIVNNSPIKFIVLISMFFLENQIKNIK